MRTHYDILQVAESASPEVINAAYRALAIQFHPDKHPGNARAAEMMRAINASYAVLSDPVLRKRYDARLSEILRSTHPVTPPPIHEVPLSRPPSYIRVISPYHRACRAAGKAIRLILFCNIRLTLVVGTIAVLWIWSAFENKHDSRPYTPNPPVANKESSPVGRVPTTQRTASHPVPFVRPSTAPNGVPWPKTPAYLPGYDQIADAGISSVVVDNTQNSSDVFLKLVSLNSAQAYPVRVCFIPARSQFTFARVTPGHYDVRYRDLVTGGYSKTESFTLTETKLDGGTDYTEMHLTLYRVRNGNMHIQGIDESEF